MAHIDPCYLWTKRSFVWRVVSSIELWNSILGLNASFHSNATNFGSQQSKKFIKIFPRLPKFDDTPLIINMLRRAIVKLYIQKGNVCCIYELFRMPNVYHLSRSSQIPNGAINYIELNSFNCHNHPATRCMFTLIVQGGSQIITHDTVGMLNSITVLVIHSNILWFD